MEAAVSSRPDDQPEQGRLDDAGGTARQVAQQAQEKVQETKGRVQSQVKDELERRSHEAGDQIGAVAQGMRRSAQELRDQGKRTRPASSTGRRRLPIGSRLICRHRTPTAWSATRRTSRGVGRLL
jgi:hypothetical protein